MRSSVGRQPACTSLTPAKAAAQAFAYGSSLDAGNRASRTTAHERCRREPQHGDEGDRGEPGAQVGRLRQGHGQRRPAACINGRVSLTDERG
jgi:hypothetical protein